MSEGPGRGSTFTVRLPVVERARLDASPPAAPASSVTAPPARVLIVEDNRDAAETMAELVELWGHDVRVAHDGAAALDAVSAFHPEIVLLDIGLPRMDGYAVAARLREQEGRSRMLLVALTGYGQEEDRQKAREAGFDAHLTKPAHPDDLRRVLTTRPTDEA